MVPWVSSIEMVLPRMHAYSASFCTNKVETDDTDKKQSLQLRKRLDAKPMSACRPTLDGSGRQEFNFQLPDAGLNSYTIQASLGRPGCSSSFWSSQVLHQSVPRCSPAAL